MSGLVMLTEMTRYWHTLRHLRPVQIYGRVWFHLPRPASKRAAVAMRPLTGPWVQAARRKASLIGPGEFEFFGESGALSKIGWTGLERSKLWRYHQHYFDDLNAVSAGERKNWHLALLEDWVKHNPPGKGDGWAPYPIAARVINWIKWNLSGNALPDFCIRSMAAQIPWLAKRLEIHLLGNHLLVNAKALVFAGLFFEGKEAKTWLDSGLRILATEIPEQILRDGGHFERSPMYHSLALEDMLDLWNIANAFPQALSPAHAGQIQEWDARIGQMRRWLATMCHPDGEIAFFNDAAMDVAPSPAELEAYAMRLGFGRNDRPKSLSWLRDSGYARLQAGSAVAMLDMAQVGPDYLPAHGHADTLSFELSLFGQRVVVNSGTSIYGVSPERLRQRGTSAHNTVIVNGRDSSEVWSGFRVARRAQPFGAKVEGNGQLAATCSHDGYHRLPGKPIHTRRWTLADRCLEVMDRVTGNPDQAEARFHFHPAVTVNLASGALAGNGTLPGGQQFAWQVVAGIGRIEDSTWHPRFGASERNKCLVVRLDRGQAAVRLTWN